MIGTTRTALLGAVLGCVSVSALAVDFGRTSGAFDVSFTGSASYTIPIWTPPGPNGLQPSIALTYDSQSDNGVGGVGWHLSAAGSIQRCQRTKHQDGEDGGVELTSADRFCIGGNRLRLISGTYGAATSVYYTEIADYSRITAFGTAGNGPQYFVVEAKSGLKYEYGATTGSRVFPGVSPTIATTPHVWMLNKVYDRNGNNYLISYNNLNGFALPDVISWTPTSLGAATYRYEAKFNYTTSRTDKDSYIGKVAGYDVNNRYRLESIQIKSAGIVVRKYRLIYDTSTVTARSRLVSAKECADDAELNCFLPIAFGYQSGMAGVTAGAVAAPAGSSNSLKAGRYDFNGDGKDDILYVNGSTWYAAFGANSGFAGPYNTGIASSASAVLADRFLPRGRDAIAAVISGTLWMYRWDDGAAAFVSYNTGISATSSTIAADADGDGLADLVSWVPSGMTMSTRRNNSTGAGDPSFESTVTTLTLGGTNKWGGLVSYVRDGLQRADADGDGRQDIYALVTVPIFNGSGQQTGVQPYTTMLFGAGSGFVFQTEPWVAGTNLGAPSLNFNGDACTDRLVGSVVYIAKCVSSTSSTVSVPATPLRLIDWDGDGKTDFLVDNGGNFGVYLSTGTGFSSLIATTIPSAGTFYAFDQDGDGLEDLVRINGASTLSYWTHTPSGSVPAFSTNLPDLLASVTDGFGVNHTPSYVSTASSNYDKGATTNFPLQESDARIVVAQVTSSNGIGGTFNRSYFYVGARDHAERAEFVGFQRVDVTDSRNGIITRTYREQSFPVSGLVSQTEVMQVNGTTPISREVFTNSFVQLDNTANNQRYFVYPSASTATQYEVGGTFNGALLRTVSTANLYDNPSGALYEQTVTTTEPASGANGASAGSTWTAKTSMPLANLVTNTGPWCLGRPGRIEQKNSNTASAYGTEITRTTTVVWNETFCRPTQSVDEPGNSTLQVTTDIGYDGFGNVNSTTVTGIGMTARITSSLYSNASFTTGQFPLSVTNALGQSSTAAWNYDLGAPLSSTDPNSLTTSWTYDSFGRRLSEDRADGTKTLWSWTGCPPGCSAPVKYYFGESQFAGASPITTGLVYFDQFDRPIGEAQRIQSAAKSRETWRDYDTLGRVAKEYFPHYNIDPSPGFISNSYDLVGRVTSTSRPISDSVATLQTANVYYEGLTTRLVDPQGKTSSKISNAAGQLAGSQDHDGYLQAFEYESFGNVSRVSEVPGSVLQSSTYNLRGMLTQRVDMDMGTWNFTPNALGETGSQTDAKNQTTTFTFDSLGRVTQRVEAEGTSIWTWGTSSSAKNIGQLASVSGPGYSESYAYDTLARPSTTTINSDTTYQIDYSYNSLGLLDTLTYPTSTSSYRLKLQYSYSYGLLSSISDFNAPTTEFWHGNELNARYQPIQETLGNGLVTHRAMDAVTGWLKSIQTGVSGGAGIQNLAYEWDLAGNLKKRKDLNQGALNEEFFYDNLYRLDYSQLNGVQNLDMAYDAMGNITSKSDVGTYTYDTTKKHQVKSTTNGWSFGYDNNGNMTSGRGATITWTSYNYPASIANGADSSTFSYTPDRQYWKQVSNYTSGGAATTIYVGGLLEKVTTSAGTDYRHMIRAGGATVIVSRNSSGTNTTNYVTSDHLGSSSAITNSSGGVLVNSSFDAFGKRRGSNWSGSPSAGDWAAIAATTRRGYTEHSMLDNLGLIHMNGRMFDPLLGRFLSADPLVTEPGNTQNFNRYSYVYNNPLRNIDPTGFGTECISGGSGCSDDEKKRAEDEASRRNLESFIYDLATRARARSTMANNPGASVDTLLIQATLQLEADYASSNGGASRAVSNAGSGSSGGLDNLDDAIPVPLDMSCSGADCEIEVCAGGGCGWHPQSRWDTFTNDVGNFSRFWEPDQWPGAGGIEGFADALGPPGQLIRGSMGVGVAGINVARAGFGGFNAARSINLTVRALSHVVDRHTVGGALSKGASLFNVGEDIATLARAANAVERVAQKGRNFESVLDAGRIIGVDRATGQATSIYTVITNAADDLITMFPGVP